MKTNSMEKYRSIIDLPYVKSSRHPQMSMTERAAQFSPFAALTGFGAVIDDAKEDYQAPDLVYDTEDPTYFGEDL